MTDKTHNGTMVVTHAHTNTHTRMVNQIHKESNG